VEAERPTGRAIQLHTDDLQRSLGALLGWAAAREITLTGLDARQPSLEEAFLAVAAGQPVAINHEEYSA
jgi:ABC-2 type transport system ATP-binding protein